MSGDVNSIISRAISVASSPDPKAVSSAYGDASGKVADEGSSVASSSDSQNSGLIDSILGKEQEDTGEAEGNEVEQESDSTDPSEGTEEATDSQKETSTDFITVKGPDGRPQKIKIDYNDKDSIKRVYAMAAGARKWQAERDNLAREREVLSTKAEKFEQLNKIFKESGPEGLLDTLTAEEGGFQKFIDKKIEEREWQRNATPEELALHQSELAKRNRDKEYDRLKQEFEELKQSQIQSQEVAEIKALESQVNPVFDKYRFAGKLGNAQEEHKLDKFLWNEAMENLQNLPDDTDITPELIMKEFRDTAQSIRKIINKQVDKQVTKAVDQKKKTAMETAQAQAIKGYASNKSDKDMRQSLKSPNVNTVTQLLTGILKRGNQ